MWRILLTLTIARFSLAMPDPQWNLDSTLNTQNNPNSLRDCECVPYYQCKDGYIISDGMGIVDMRFGLRDVTLPRPTRHRQNCTDILDVCCKLPPTHPIEENNCGKNYINANLRMDGVSYNESYFGEFPWTAIILQKNSNIKPTSYRCGGSLIHRQAVLTAAHCVQGKSPTDLEVRVGEWDTQAKNEAFPHQERNVQSVIVHEMYSPYNLRNDFAILILSEPVNLMNNVNVICLPERNMVFDESRCYASGWGKDIFGKEGCYHAVMKKVDLPIVPRHRCQRRLRSTRLGKYFDLHESFICAGGEAGKDTCKGDGGSPLVCPSKSNPAIYVQAGIVSWGIGCGDNAIPGVYANVALARDWIDEQMAFNNLDNTVYQLAT